MRLLPLLWLAACGPKLGPPEVTYGPPQPLPMHGTSADAGRWYAVVDTHTHGERVFFFDTGFARTTCDDDFAADLDLQTRGVVFVHGVGGRLVATKARLPELQVGGHRVGAFACIVRDLDSTSSIKDPHDLDVAGVIGADLLTQFVTTIDPSLGRITLFEPGKHPDPRGARVALRRSGPAGVRFMVPATLAGRERWWLLDTGASGTHVDGSRYGLTPTSYREDVWIGGTGRTGGSRVDLGFHDQMSLRFGRRSVEGLRLIDRPHGPFGFDILGLNVLRHYILTLDPSSRSLHLFPLDTPATLDVLDGRRR
jgi:hypothetical protein